MDGSGNPPACGGMNHRVGGISPGAHHKVGLELIQNRVGLPSGAVHIEQGLEVVFHSRRAQGTVKVCDGNRTDGIALLWHQPGLHAAVRPDKEDLTARVPLLKQPGQGDGGVDVPRRAAAGKEKFHRSAALLLWITPVWGPVSAVRR